jgi:hypothetical protein
VTFFLPGEPLGWRAGDISTSLLPKQRHPYSTALLGSWSHLEHKPPVYGIVPNQEKLE